MHCSYDSKSSVLTDQLEGYKTILLATIYDPYQCTRSKKPAAVNNPVIQSIPYQSQLDVFIGYIAL